MSASPFPTGAASPGKRGHRHRQLVHDGDEPTNESSRQAAWRNKSALVPRPLAASSGQVHASRALAPGSRSATTTGQRSCARSAQLRDCVRSFRRAEGSAGMIILCSRRPGRKAPVDTRLLERYDLSLADPGPGTARIPAFKSHPGLREPGPCRTGCGPRRGSARRRVLHGELRPGLRPVAYGLPPVLAAGGASRPDSPLRGQSLSVAAFAEPRTREQPARVWLGVRPGRCPPRSVVLVAVSVAGSIAVGAGTGGRRW